MLELAGPKGFDFSLDGQDSCLCCGRVCKEVEDGKKGASSVLKRWRCARNLRMSRDGQNKSSERH